MDHSSEIQEQVQQANRNRSPLQIVGGNSKSFYGHSLSADVLDVSKHSGILEYEPTELVFTARAGTLLSEIESTLAEQNQMLAFEPPAFSDTATIGGTIACNLSGPRRAYAGAARDFFLGCKLINGTGNIMQFGGQVMKNVAGYDVTRLMAGAMGTLGVLLETSFKVLPCPESEQTQVMECSVSQALEQMQSWSQKPLPISALTYDRGNLYVRLSGTEKAVFTAVRRVGGTTLDNAAEFWKQLKEHQSSFFTDSKPLWRLSLASDTPELTLSGETLYEWGGALRWLSTNESAEAVFSTAAEFGGHASLFCTPAKSEQLFQPLPAGLMRVHQNIKKAFDPENILNPGKQYQQL